MKNVYEMNDADITWDLQISLAKSDIYNMVAAMENYIHC